MSQPTDHDFSQASGLAGTAFRTALNDYLAAVLTKNSGGSDPTTTFAFMDYVDTGASPTEWQIRNEADSAFIKLAEINASDIKLFSEGAAVVGLANTDPFTENQKIEKTGSAANFTVKSDLATGIVASLDLSGENDANEEIVAAAFDASVTDDTDGSEDTSLAIKVLQGGSETTRMTIGSTVAVTGTMNATTLQQGGTSVASLIEAEINSLDEDSFTGSVDVQSDLTAGDMNTFTGSSASNVTIDSGTAGEIYPILNDGSAALTFVAGGGVTIVGATGLAAQKTCSIYYRTATRAFIFGENA